VSQFDLSGIWIPCAGSLTSWNSHLGSEEYEPDAKLLAANVTYDKFKSMWTEDEVGSVSDIVNFLRFFGVYYPTYENDMDLIRSTFNPCKFNMFVASGVCVKRT
jgi:hypothetical protein